MSNMNEEKEKAIAQFLYENDTYYLESFKKYRGNDQCFGAGFDAGVKAERNRIYTSAIDKEKLLLWIKETPLELTKKHFEYELVGRIEDGEFDLC